MKLHGQHRCCACWCCQTSSCPAGCLSSIKLVRLCAAPSLCIIRPWAASTAWERPATSLILGGKKKFHASGLHTTLPPCVLALRSLVAAQVADRLNSMGVPCNLATGQETRSIKGARHTACTVEMADLTSAVDVSMRTVSRVHSVRPGQCVCGGGV
jgi:hypothetical protein